MPSSVYDVAVRLRLNTGGLAGTASMAIGIFEKIEARAAAAGASTAALSRSMALLGGGLAVTGGGLALADGLGKAAKKGAELQVVMAGIGLATGASQRQMAALQSTFTSIGLKNQMSQIDVAQLALASTHAGITNLAQLRASIGTIANFAEVQQLSTGVSRESAATTGVEYAHIFGAYTPQLLNPLINVLSKALTHTPLTGAAFETLVSQFAGQTSSLYGRSTPARLAAQRDDTMMGVLLGQMGQGTRGGTQFGSGLIHLATAKPGTAAYAAEQRLETAGGGRFFNQDGSFRGIRNLLSIITHAADVLTPGQMTAINKTAFGTVGMKTFGNLEQDARLGQWDQNAQTFARIPDIGRQQAVYNATAAGQSQQWHKNIETIVTIFGTALLPTLIKVSNALVGITRRVVEFMQANPRVVQIAAGFAMVATAAALIIGPVLAAAGAFGLLAAASVPVLPIVLGITAAVAAAVLIFQNWSTVVAFLNNPLGALTGKFGLIGQGIMLAFAPLIGLIEGFSLLWAVGAKVIDWAGGFAGIGRTIGGVFGAIGGAFGLLGSYFTPLVQMFGALLALGGHLVDWASKLPGVAGAISAALTIAFAPLTLAIDALKVLHGFWDWLTGNHNTGHASAATAGAAAARANIPVIARQAHRYTQAHGLETAQHGMWQYQQLVLGKGEVWRNDGRVAPRVSPWDPSSLLDGRAVAALWQLASAAPLLPRKTGGMALIGQPLASGRGLPPSPPTVLSHLALMPAATAARVAAQASALSAAMVALVNAPLLQRTGGLALIGHPLSATAGAHPVVHNHYHNHIEVHPGAAHLEVHPAPHQDARAIAREAADLASTEIATKVSNAISRNALSVTTAFPSLHVGTMGPS